MPETGRFESFRLIVLADLGLQARLRSIRDWPAFVEAAVQASAELGIPLTEADLLAARDESRRSWLERWL